MNLNFALALLVLGILAMEAFVCLTVVIFIAIVFGKDQTTLKALDVFKSLFRYLPRINFPQLPQGGEESDPPEGGENTP